MLSANNLTGSNVGQVLNLPLSPGAPAAGHALLRRFRSQGRDGRRAVDHFDLVPVLIEDAHDEAPETVPLRLDDELDAVIDHDLVEVVDGIGGQDDACPDARFLIPLRRQVENDARPALRQRQLDPPFGAAIVGNGEVKYLGVELQRLVEVGDGHHDRVDADVASDIRFGGLSAHGVAEGHG